MSDFWQRPSQAQAEALRGQFIGYGSGYQVQSFTPSYYGQTTPGTTTYTAQQGTYILIGQSVFVNCRVVWTAATGTGNALISLPFTCGGTANDFFPAALWTNNVTWTQTGVQAMVQGGTNFLLLASPASNAGWVNLAIEAAGDIAVNVFYVL